MLSHVVIFIVNTYFLFQKLMKDEGNFCSYLCYDMLCHVSVFATYQPCDVILNFVFAVKILFAVFHWERKNRSTLAFRTEMYNRYPLKDIYYYEKPKPNWNFSVTTFRAFRKYNMRAIVKISFILYKFLIRI